MIMNIEQIDQCVISYPRVLVFPSLLANKEASKFMVVIRTTKNRPQTRVTDTNGLIYRPILMIYKQRSNERCLV